jgi:hypothetical protein
MQILNYRTTRQLLTQPFEAAELASSVAQTLEHNNWLLGQPRGPQDTLRDFAAWLNPQVDEQAQAAGVFDLSAGKAILALAIHYFSQRYPNASQLDIASASKMVEFGVTGMSGGFGTDEYPLERYCEQLLMAALGGAMADEGWGFVPQEAVERAPSAEQTTLLFNLVEAVYFKTRPPKDQKAAIRSARAVRERGVAADAANPAAVLADVIADLDSTRQAFKSKVIAGAREKLQALLLSLEGK